MTEQVNGPEMAEKPKEGPIIIGVIGPPAIGKDTIIKGLIDNINIPGKRIVSFSIGQYIRDNFYQADDEARHEAENRFYHQMDEAGIAYLNEWDGTWWRRGAVLDWVIEMYKKKEPIPVRVADWILREFLTSCSSDTVVLLNGGPFSANDLRFMESHHSPAGLIYLSPTAEEWKVKIPERQRKRARVGDKDIPLERQVEKWKKRTKELLDQAHYDDRYRIIHVNLRDPSLSETEVNERLIPELGECIKELLEGRQKKRVRIIEVGGS